MKPFEVHVTKEEETKKQEQPKKIRPFETIDTPKEKLYLILKIYEDQENDSEELRDFEFFTGTSQNLYDHLKEEIELNSGIDVMRSRVLVDSPNISISHKCSVFMFMRDTKDLGKIIDDSSFDINDYYYEVDEGGDANGQE